MIGQALADLINRLGIIGELLHFLWKRKLWWLVPMITLLLVFALFLVLAQVAGVGPFVYSLF